MQNHKNTKTRNIEIQNTKQKQPKNKKKYHETGEGRISQQKIALLWENWKIPSENNCHEYQCK